MKSGFVSIIGRPNVGKSSLMNEILDYNLAIATNTPQTTRDKIKGIYNSPTGQIVFLDTPGIHKPKQKLGERLNNIAIESLKECDLIIFLQPINEKIGPGDKFIIEKVNKNKSFAIMTKLDLGDKHLAKKRADELKKLGFKDILGTSKEMPESISHLIEYVYSRLPEQEPYYNTDDITDRSMRFLAEEIIREAAINNTKQEIPHSLAVVVDDFKEEDIYKINATIFVERESQKGIVVGKNGSLIKKIGIESRNKMEDNFQTKVFLKLRVKVDKNWTNVDKKIKLMGY